MILSSRLIVFAIINALFCSACTQSPKKEVSSSEIEHPVEAQTVENTPAKYVLKDKVKYYTLYDGTACVGPSFFNGQTFAIRLKSDEAVDNMMFRLKNGQHEYTVKPSHYVSETKELVATVDPSIRAGNYTASLVADGKAVSDCYAVSVLAYKGQPYLNMLNCLSAKCQTNDRYELKKGELYTLGVPYTVSGNSAAKYSADYADAEQAEIVFISTTDQSEVSSVPVALPKSVESVPRFTLPNTIKPGEYLLRLTVTNAAGKRVSSEPFQYIVVVR